MDTNTAFTFLQTSLGALGVIVSVIGTLLVLLAWVEYGKVRTLRDEVHAMLASIKEHQRRAQKAQQRIIASHGEKDPTRRVVLIQSAIDTDPDTFNGYNALGYALLELNDRSGATAAFMQATIRHPTAKEGWLDLAVAYRAAGEDLLAKRMVYKAIDADPSAHDDVAEDPRLADLL